MYFYPFFIYSWKFRNQTGVRMAKKNSQFVDYEGSDFDEEEDENEVDENEPFPESASQSEGDSVATWRKIEDFWDNYNLNKRINDDPYSDKYFDYLLDGELN